MKLDKRLIVSAGLIFCLGIAGVSGHFLTKDTNVPKPITPVVEEEPTPAPSIEDQEEKKIVYLTFDDGPQPGVTDKVLDILKEEDIRATFFVVGKMVDKNPELLKRTFDEGHTIGNHTNSHVYNELYSTVESFIAGINEAETSIENAIGQKTAIFRFPGGSYLNKLKPYREAVTQEGFVYYDWNVDSGDSKRTGVPTAEIVAGTKEGIDKAEAQNLHRLVILLHDSGGHKNSMEALKEIISYLKEKGYEFSAITDKTKQVKF